LSQILHGFIIVKIGFRKARLGRLRRKPEEASKLEESGKLPKGGPSFNWKLKDSS